MANAEFRFCILRFPSSTGEAYRISIAVLALCVPQRYLPLYQK